MRKVKEFWDLIDVLKAQGYEWGGSSLINTSRFPSLFSVNMFRCCGHDQDEGYTWDNDWLEPEANSDIGKFCKFWDTAEEPDNKLAEFSFLRSDRGESAVLRWTASSGDSWAYYRVVDVNIK